MAESSTRSIPLTKGFVATVDAADFDMLSHWRWYADERHGSVYAVTKVASNGLRRKLRMHRVLALPGPSEMVDHVNGDSLDNRRANLRVCSNAENQRNRSPYLGKSSTFKGVSWHEPSGKWKASIKVLGELCYLGVFDTERDAAAAYDAAAQVAFGDFARVNGVS